MMSRGLASNPFSAARFAPGVVPWLPCAEGDTSELYARALASRGGVQVVGDHGTGKTTLLAHLAAHGRREGHVVLRARGSRGLSWPALVRLGRSREPRVLLVDEIEELGAVAFAALRTFARAFRVALVVSAHRDVGLPTLARRRVDARTAKHVVGHLLRAQPARASIDDLEGRLARHRGNLREVLFELYDEAEEAGAISPR